MSEPRYKIIQVQSNIFGLQRIVAEWIGEHGACWEPVGAPFPTDGYHWNQAMFYREASDER